MAARGAFPELTKNNWELMQKYHQMIIFLLLFDCLMQCYDNGNSCMYTVLYTAVLELIAVSINISINSLTAVKSSDTFHKHL